MNTSYIFIIQQMFLFCNSNLEFKIQIHILNVKFYLKIWNSNALDLLISFDNVESHWLQIWNLTSLQLSNTDYHCIFSVRCCEIWNPIACYLSVLKETITTQPVILLNLLNNCIKFGTMPPITLFPWVMFCYCRLHPGLKPATPTCSVANRSPAFWPISTSFLQWHHQ